MCLLSAGSVAAASLRGDEDHSCAPFGVGSPCDTGHSAEQMPLTALADNRLFMAIFLIDSYWHIADMMFPYRQPKSSPSQP